MIRCGGVECGTEWWAVVWSGLLSLLWGRNHDRLLLSDPANQTHTHTHTHTQRERERERHAQIRNNFFSIILFSPPSNLIYNIFGKHENHLANSSFILSYKVPVAK